MCRVASRIVVLGLGGSGAGAGTCTGTGAGLWAGLGGAGASCELCASGLAIGSSMMVIFFLRGALSGAPLGLPLLLGAGSVVGSGAAGFISIFSGIVSSFSGIVSFVSGVVSIVSAILPLLNIFF